MIFEIPWNVLTVDGRLNFRPFNGWRLWDPPIFDSELESQSYACSLRMRAYVSYFLCHFPAATKEIRERVILVPRGRRFLVTSSGNEGKCNRPKNNKAWIKLSEAILIILGYSWETFLFLTPSKTDKRVPSSKAHQQPENWLTGKFPSRRMSRLALLANFGCGHKPSVGGGKEVSDK